MHQHLTHIPKVHILFDNDEAGEKGARKIKMAMCRAQIAQLPKWHKDIGEMFQLDYAPTEWFTENLR